MTPSAHAEYTTHTFTESSLVPLQRRGRVRSIDISRLSAPDPNLFAPGLLVETNFYTGHHTHWVMAKVLTINSRDDRCEESSYHIVRMDGHEDHVVPAYHLRPAGKCATLEA